jgi:hypothetical protein
MKPMEITVSSLEIPNGKTMIGWRLERDDGTGENTDWLTIDFNDGSQIDIYFNTTTGCIVVEGD